MDDAPRRSGPVLPLVLLACAAWGAVAALQVLRHPAAGLDAALALATALLPPLIAALLAFGLLRRPAQRPELDGVEARLAAAGLNAEDIQGRLQSLDAALGTSLGQAERMAEAASGQGQGLGASARALGLAAGELVNAGEEATRAAGLLTASVPDLGRQVAGLAEVMRRLGTETAEQILAIDTLLAKVGVRGREVAGEANAVIAGMNRQLAAVDEHSKDTTSALAKRAYALDAAIDGVLERSVTVCDDIGARIAAQTGAFEARLATTRATIDELGSEGSRVVGERLDRLIGTAGELRDLFDGHGASSQALIDTTDRHLASLPARLDEARTAHEATAAELIARINTVHGTLNNLRGPFAASETAVTALGEQLDVLRRVADELGVGLAGRLPATVREIRDLDAGAEALVQRIEGVRETLLASGEATRNIREQVGAARVELAALGEADARQVGERLDALHQAALRLGEQMTAHGALSGRTADAVGADLAALSERVAAAQRDGEARLGALSDHVGSVQGAIDGMARPLADARSVLGDIDGQLEHFGAGMTSFGEGLDARFAATAQALTGLAADAAALTERSDALQAAVAAGAGAIGGAAEAFEQQRGELARGAEALAGHFDRARAVLDDIRGETDRAADDASERLNPVFEHARILSEAGAAAMQQMLGNVVDEAEKALERAGSATAESAFATPIKAQLAAVEAASERAGMAAETAAARVAGQAEGLTGMIAAVEDKVAEIETRIDVRARDTLAARSARLVEQLNDASVDVAKLLAVDAGENAWAEYLGGDRSVFARRTVRLLDREMTRKIARHWQHDAAFREEAGRYLDAFETLTKRVLGDPDGEALMATIVSSDIGKLYVAIARSIGRLELAA